jgi:hypothetical protein
MTPVVSTASATSSTKSSDAGTPGIMSSAAKLVVKHPAVVALAVGTVIVGGGPEDPLGDAAAIAEIKAAEEVAIDTPEASSAGSAEAGADLSKTAPSPDSLAEAFASRESALPQTAQKVIDSSKSHPAKRIVHGDSLQLQKSGGIGAADSDFDSMQPGHVKDYGNGVRTGVLEDGTQVVVRPRSQPTVEITPKVGQSYTIRYDDN